MDCKKLMRNYRTFKDKMLCWNCYNKRVNLLPKKTAISLEKALSKTYEINGYINNQQRLVAARTFPSILIGHKVKLVLVK